MSYRTGDKNFNNLKVNGVSVKELTVTGCNFNGTFVKGDILTSDGSKFHKLHVGADGEVLKADSSKSIGLSWVGNAETLDSKLQVIDTYMYEYELNNTPTILMNSHFATGTYRIRSSGVYKLGENIVFNPNPGDDHMPTPSQITSGDYPVMPTGPYHLGFFTAIAIEADNVVIDLNGFRLDQSVAHQLQQRFFSCIQLGGSPFIPTQGPTNFGDIVLYPQNVLIRNGTLGKSAHHGIHGNSARNVIVSDVEFTAFEFAGLAINGSTNILCRNISVHDNELNVRVLASYSQSRFVRSFMRKIIDDNGSPGPSILIKGVSKTGLDILTELETAMANVYDVVVNGNGVFSDHADALFYENTNVGLDGSVYGMAFNTVGVLVDGFIQNRNSLAGGNENIKLVNIMIDDLESTPMEIVGLTDDSGVSSYGANLQKGPVGDVFRIVEVTNLDGSYKPNVLANAQLYVSSVGVGPEQRGGSSIDADVIAWAGSAGDTTVAGTHYYQCDGDSMAHTMKGNIGLFLSGTTTLECDELIISNVVNHGSIGENEKPSGLPCQNSGTVYEGNNSRGLLFVSTKDTTMKNTRVFGTESDTGNGMNYDYIGANDCVTLV
jgi:hypothetical protein